MNNEMQTVKLVNGKNRVTTTTVKGTDRATWANSAGDFAVIALDDARERVAAMLANGWRIA